MVGHGDLRRLRQEDHKFKASLDYITRSCLRKETKQSYVNSSGMGISILSVIKEAITGTSSQHYSPPQQGKPRHQDVDSGGTGGDLWQEGLEALCDRQTLCIECRHSLLLR